MGAAGTDGGMRSAFGIEHVSKGLPSSISRTPVGALKPLSHSAAKKQANIHGKQTAKMTSIWRTKRDSKFNQGGWTNMRAQAGASTNAGRSASREAAARMSPPIQSKRKRVLP